MLQRAHAHAAPAVREPRLDRAVGDPPLLERAAELGVLGDALAGASAGRGAVIVPRPPPASARPPSSTTPSGAQPKPAATSAARPRARSSVTSYGVVRTLLETPLRGASERERARLPRAPPATRASSCSASRSLDGEATTMVAHSIFWLCSALAASRPLVLVVDDAQWSDRASLEVLAYSRGGSSSSRS
jgi:hypothetical protein